MNIKPMLAVKITELDNIAFPVYVSPKMDGIRCLVSEGVAVARSLKPIRNVHIKSTLFALFSDYDCVLDGELIVAEPTAADCFKVSHSAIMSGKGTPAFTYNVFDIQLPAPRNHLPYAERIDTLEWMLRNDASIPSTTINIIPITLVDDKSALLELEAAYLDEGYEGIIIRSPDGQYKHGRATVKEGTFFKLKRFSDAEAIVIDYVKMDHDGGDMLGALLVKDIVTNQTFSVGSGFTMQERLKWWEDRQAVVGTVIKYSFFNYGVDVAPRFPTFKGIRSTDDM